jgi:cell division protein FtsI (penicillin-binding protein 3)
MKNLDPSRARWIRGRGILLGLALGAIGVNVIVRAWEMQVQQGAAWRETAEKQRQRKLHVEPRRGRIVDRHDRALALTIDVPSVSLDMHDLVAGAVTPEAKAARVHDAALRLSAALALDPVELERRMSSGGRFLWVKHRVSGEEAEAARRMANPREEPNPIRGLGVDGEGRRYYPNRELGSTLLGFVSPDGQGREGLELFFDQDLRGRPEELSGLRDRGGRLVFTDGTADRARLETEGQTIELAIDQSIQYIAERELEAAVRNHEAKGGTVVVVEPSSGDILAMASFPNFNPNDYGAYQPDARRNRAIADRFEPGSVMKVFTFAGAFSAGLVAPGELINCEHGRFRVGGATIHDTHLNDLLTPKDILAKSSNIGSLKVGLRLGAERLYDVFRGFGFGEPTGLPLAGESGGVLHPKARTWVELETANASFGQGIGVTSLQLAMGFAALANGGRLMEPILARRIVDGRGQTIREWNRHVKREATTPHVARMLSDMLVAVTEPGGTAVEAAIDGYRVAGKTATAQKVDPHTGRYSADRFSASFAGYLPAESPRLVISVTIDEPLVGHFGGELAAPVFRRVAEQSLRYMGVVPARGPARLDAQTEAKADAKAEIVKVVDARAGSVQGASNGGGAANVGPAAAGGANIGPAASAAPGEPSLPRDLSVTPEPERTAANEVRVPEATGLPARDAMRVLLGAGLVPRIEGTGRLVRQDPPPGTAIPRGATVKLVLEPPS